MLLESSSELDIYLFLKIPKEQLWDMDLAANTSDNELHEYNFQS